jgi:hypothetical protein
MQALKGALYLIEVAFSEQDNSDTASARNLPYCRRELCGSPAYSFGTCCVRKMWSDSIQYIYVV